MKILQSLLLQFKNVDDYHRNLISQNLCVCNYSATFSGDVESLLPVEFLLSKKHTVYL